MQTSDVDQVDSKPTPTYQSFGIYPSRDGPDGTRKGSILKINLTVKTNDSKEQLLTYVDTLRDMIKESIEENYDSFIVPDNELVL
jgi:hypothetical protein